MFSCRLGVLRAGDADEVRQHAPRVGALCVAEADGVGHRVRHAQHLQPAVRRIARMSRRITPFGAMLCTAVTASMIACNQTLSILLTHQLCTDVPGGAPSPDLKTAPNVVQ